MKKQIITLALILIGLCSGLAQNGISTKELKDSISSILKSKNIPGAFISVVSKDSVLFRSGVGYADIEEDVRVSNSHLFKIGSISKTFTALAIMKMINEGKLSLESELKMVAPEVPFKNRWEKSNPVKIKHLLEHKAGFDDMHLSVLAGTYTKDMTALDEVMKSKGSLKSRWQPGLAHSYSNPGYTVLGFIIEKISGMRYQDYIQKEVLRPLHMKETIYRSAAGEELNSQKFAKGYSYYSDTINTTRDVRIIGESAGGILSNASDMARFAQYFLNEGLQDSIPLVGKNGIEEMEKLHGDLETAYSVDNGYGLGLYATEYGEDKIPFKGHNGGINGFSANFIYSKELNLGIVMVNNGEGGNRKVLDLLVDTFGEKSPTGSGVKEKTVDLAKFSGWEGTYRTLGRRNQMFDFIQLPVETAQLSFENDTLFITKFMQDPIAFRFSGARSFREKDNPNSSLYLVEHEGQELLNFDNDIYLPTNGFGFVLFRLLMAMILISGLLVILSTIVLSLGSVFKKRLGKAALRGLIFSVPFLLFFISLGLFLPNLSLEKIQVLGSLNITTISIFLSTALMPLTAAYALYWLYKNWEQISKKYVRYLLSVIVGCSLFLSGYCIYHGWFMKLLWA